MYIECVWCRKLGRKGERKEKNPRDSLGRGGEKR